MPRKAPPPPYPPEFRHRLIELVRSGQKPEALAKKFEPSAATTRNWVCQADLDEGVRWTAMRRAYPAPDSLATNGDED